MTDLVLREVSLAEDCPTIRHRVFLLQDEAQEESAILIVAFEGRYRDCSEGNPDAAFMRGQIDLARGVWWYHSGLVIDLSKLSYRGGDQILLPLQNSEHMPSAIVVGPDCEGALATLMCDDDPQSVTDFDDIFDNLEAAIAYVQRPRPGGPPG